MSRQSKNHKVLSKAREVQSTHNSGNRAGKLIRWDNIKTTKSQAKRENRGTRPTNHGYHPTY